MKNFVFTPEGVDGCEVTAWLHTEAESPEMAARQLPAVVVCPGGGYEFTSDREAEPVAEEYFAAGYNTFIIRYSVGERAKNFEPLCQLAATVAHIRKNADGLHTASDKIAVCGFSAGGHLAASLGTLFNEERFLKAFGRDENVRPDAMILGYPVITADEYTHTGTIRHVSGSDEGTEQYNWFGLDGHVDGHTPPAFLWHTSDDQGVPVMNSLKFAEALSHAGVPFELHVLPSGPHGMSVCTAAVGSDDKYNARWVGWSVEWLGRLFGFEK